MKPVPFEQVSAAFERVCDEPEGRRTALLDQICGEDEALRAAVEQMLAADAASSPLLDGPPEAGMARALAADLGRPSPPPLPERIGPYRVLREIGAGGMGVVYEAEQDHPRRRIALKCVHPDLHSERIDQQFYVEAEAMGQLLHPNIPQVYEASEADGQLYLAMELVHGDPLSQYLRLRQPGLRERLRLLIALCNATAHAHAKGVIHCDLKPGNVLVTADGEPKVLDFGVARFVRGDGQRGFVMGTPAYMSPERLRNEPDVDGRADVYALGVIAYQALSGRAPYSTTVTTTDAVLRAIEAGAPPLELGRDLVSRDLEAVVTRAMAPDREARYPTALALEEDLQRILQDEPVLARPPTLGYRLAKRWARHRAMVRTVLAVLLAVGLTWGAVRGGQALLRSSAQRSANAAAAVALPRALAAYSAKVEQGDVAGADAALLGFLEGPGLRGTEARSAAWLAYGERLRDQGRAEDELEAYASAYAAAPDAGSRRRSLFALAAAFRARWDFDALSVVLETIGGGPEPRLLQWRRDVRLARRDLAGAAQLSEGGTAGLLRALASAQAMDLVADEASMMDVDGDAQAELLFYDQGARRLQVVTAEAGFAPLGAVSLPEQDGLRAERVFAVPHARPAILAQYSGPERARAAYLYDLEASGARLSDGWRWDEPSMGAAISADVDGDGASEIYAGTGAYTRRLVRLDPSGSGWAESAPHPASNALDSSVGPLLAIDLDGDGGDELLAASAEWQAYALRLYRPRGEGLELVDQVRLGTTRWLGRFVRAGGETVALAFIDHGYENPRLFGAEHPFAGPFGWYTLRLDAAGRLEATKVADYRAPFSGAPPRWWTAETGDFDGDGLQDVALGEYQGSTLVLRQRGDGGFDEVLLGGVRPLAALDVDEDPADELIVRASDGSRAVWVLGAGEDAMPSLPEAPARARAGRGARWAVVDDLVAMGLTRRAAALLEEGSAGLAAPAEVAEVLLWAAELHEASGDLESALRLLERAALEDPAHEAAQLRRGHVLARMHRFADASEDALRLIQERELSAEARAQVEARQRSLHRFVAMGPAVMVDFSLPLARAWQVQDPVAMRRSARRRQLWLQASADGGTIARLPLEHVWSRVSMRVRLDITRAEFGSHLYIGLRPKGGGPRSGIGFGVELWGGGGQTTRSLRWYAPSLDRTASWGADRPVDPARYTEALEVWLSHAPGYGLRIEVRDPATSALLVARTEPASERPLPGGAWALVLGVLDNDEYGGPLQLEARVHWARLWGMVERDVPGDPGAWALAEGLPRQAQPGLRDRPALQALAAAELGQFDEAADWAAQVDDVEQLAHLLRRVDQGLESRLQARLGPAFYEAYARAWAMSYRHHLTAQVVNRMSGEAFAALDGRTSAQRELLLLRAEAGLEHGGLPRAERDLRRVLSRRPEGEQARQAHLLMARLAAATSRPQLARAHVAAFLESSPDAFLADQTLARDPRLTRLRPGFEDD